MGAWAFTTKARGSHPRPGHIRPCLARALPLLLWSRTTQPSAAAEVKIQPWQQLSDKDGARALLRWVIMLRACFTEMQGLSDKAHACSCCRGNWEAERRGQGLKVTLLLGEPIADNEMLIDLGSHTQTPLLCSAMKFYLSHVYTQGTFPAGLFPEFQARGRARVPQPPSAPIK